MRRFRFNVSAFVNGPLEVCMLVWKEAPRAGHQASLITAAHLKSPTADQDDNGKQLLAGPQSKSDLGFLFSCEFFPSNFSPTDGKFDHSPLSITVDKPLTVMADVKPPVDGKEQGVERAE